MANLTEQATWEDNVEEFALTDPVQGGPGGIDNVPHQRLANRTQWLKARIAEILSAIGLLAPKASPTFTGSPQVPELALADRTLRIPSAKWGHALRGGITYKAVTAGTVTLTPEEAGAGIIVFQGTLNGDCTVTVPALQDRWTMVNYATGTSALRVKCTIGEGVRIEGGRARTLWCDSATVFAGENDLRDASLTGTPTAPTAARGTATTQVATTGFTADSVAVEAAARGAEDGRIEGASIARDNDLGTSITNLASLRASEDGRIEGASVARDGDLSRAITSEAQTRSSEDGRVEAGSVARDNVLSEAIATKVSRTGDTMTGPLVQVANTPLYRLQRPGQGGQVWDFSLGEDGVLRFYNLNTGQSVLDIRPDASVHNFSGTMHAFAGNLSFDPQKGAVLVNPDYRLGRILWNNANYLEIVVDGTYRSIPTNASDRTLKERIVPTALRMRDVIPHVEFVDFAYRATREEDGPSPLKIGGVIAQQAMEFAPHWFVQLTDGTWHVDPLVVATNTLKLCQEQEAEIVALRGDVEALRAALADLARRVPAS